MEGLKAAEQVLGGEQHASADGLDYGGVCRMTQLDGGRCRISAQADDSMGSCGACSMTSLDSMSSCSSGEQDKNGLGVAKSSLSTGGRRMWIAKKKQDGSASSSTSTTMDGVHGDAGNLKKDDSGTLVGDPSMVDEGIGRQTKFFFTFWACVQGRCRSATWGPGPGFGRRGWWIWWWG